MFLSITVLKLLLPKNPTSRHQTPAEMLFDIKSNTSQPPLPKNKTNEVKNNNKIVPLLISVLVVLLICGVGFLWHFLSSRNYISVSINTEPQGCFIYVDGILHEDNLTPTKISVSKEFHNISVSKDGFKNDGADFYLKNEKKKVIDINFELCRNDTSVIVDDGLLKVQSNPDQSKIFLDGVYIGDTPLSDFGLVSGEHNVYVSKKGYYKSKPGTFSVIKNKLGQAPFKTSMQLVLVKIPPQAKKSELAEPSIETLSNFPGTLKISTIPEGSLVYINDEFADTTPLVIQLSSELYKITIKSNGYFDYEDDMNLEPNNISQMNISLVRKIGKPILINPTDNKYDLAPPFEFTWEKAENAAYYRVFITNDKTGENIFEDSGQIVLENAFFVENNLLEKGQKYYWMVKAFTDESELIFSNSDTFSFTTKSEKVIVKKPLINVLTTFFAFNKDKDPLEGEVLLYINGSFVDTLPCTYSFEKNTHYKIRVGSDNYGYQTKNIFYDSSYGKTSSQNFFFENN